MVAKDRIAISLGDAGYQAFAALSQRFKASLAWLGRRVLFDLIEKYGGSGAQLPATFPKERHGGGNQ